MYLASEVKRALSARTTENCRALRALEESSGAPGHLPQDVGGWIRGRRDYDRLGDVFLLLGQDGFVHGLGEEGSPVEVSPQEGGIPVLVDESSSHQVLVRLADIAAPGVPLRRAQFQAGRAHPVISFREDPYEEEFVLLRPREVPRQSFLAGQQRALFKKLSAPLSSGITPSREANGPSSCCENVSLLGTTQRAARSSSNSLPAWALVLIGIVSFTCVGGILWLLHRHEKARTVKHT